MRPRVITKSSLLLLACAACVSQAHAAGDAAATSGYLTIQPDGAGNTVYTFSWVARDTDNASTGVGYTDTGTTNPFGNGTAVLDNVNNVFGGNYTFDNSANGGSLTTSIRYASGMATGSESDNVPVNTTTWVNYQDPLNTTIGGAGVSTALPKWDSSGNWTKVGSAYYASGVQGTTGVMGLAADGSDALAAGVAGAVHQGVGFGHDTDGANDATGTDDFGVILAGYDYVNDPTKSNTMPNTGYVRVVVPDPVDPTSFAQRFNEGVFTNNAAVEITVTSSTSYTAKIALAGDMDSDFDIDNADIGGITGNFTGSVAAGGKWYATGDMTADGDVDNADIGIVTGGFTGSLAGNLTPTVGVPDLIYDPGTGNMTVDTDGKTITSFQLENGGAGTFNSGNYISPADFPNNGFGFGFEQVSGTVIGDSDGLNLGFTGTHDFGNILPTGLTQEQLEAYLSTAFWGTLGQGSGDFDLVVAVIPEPGAVLLGGLGLLTLLRRRRS